MKLFQAWQSPSNQLGTKIYAGGMMAQGQQRKKIMNDVDPALAEALAIKATRKLTLHYLQQIHATVEKILQILEDGERQKAIFSREFHTIFSGKGLNDESRKTDDT